MNLKTRARVNPRILKGSKTSQTSGKRNSRSKANGQHIINKINHRISAIKVLMIATVWDALANDWPNY
jgi:hypothetical protein